MKVHSLPTETDKAINELQSRRLVHVDRCEHRQKFALTCYLAGTAAVLGLLTAAEASGADGKQFNLRLHWLMPLFCIAVWSLTLRWHWLSSRYEEYMIRLYDKQIQWLIGPQSDLHPSLTNLRDDYVQFYSIKKGILKSTRLIQFLGEVPIMAVFIFSLSNIAFDRAPFLWGTSANAEAFYRFFWSLFSIALWAIIYYVRLARQKELKEARHRLDTINNPFE